jgi:ribosomal protein L29
MALSYPTIQKKKTYTAPTSSGTGNTLASMTNPYEYNPGGSGEQAGAGGGTVQPQSYVGGQVQQRNSLSSLPENLANSYQNTLASMMSGDAYSPYKTSQFQGMNKSAQQIRANAQQANVGRAGQGTAIANKNATEAGIAQMAGETALSALQGEQEMKERGLAATNTLVGMNENVRANDINQAMATDTAYGYIDPVTGKRVGGSNELGYAQISSSEKISQNQLDESARQYNITNQTDKDQFAATMKLNYDQLSEQQKQFLMNFGLDEAKFSEAKRQYDTTTSLEDKYRTKDLDLKERELSQQASQFKDRLSFDKWATQAGLNDAAANRIWQATQNDKALNNAYNIASMQNDTERWKQEQVTQLTKDGWTVEDARAQADRDNALSLANLQVNLQRDIAAGTWEDKNGNTVTSVQAQELAQRATQFTSAQEFEREMSKTQMLDENGKPMFDAYGKPVMIDKDLANRLFITAERTASQSWQETENSYNRLMEKDIAAGQWVDEGGKTIETAQRISLMGQLKIAESSLTGKYEGKETLASKELTANLTGYLDGVKTLSREQLDESIKQIKAELTGSYEGADTLAKKELDEKIKQVKAELTGLYDGKDTLSKQELATKQEQIKAELTGLYNGAETLAMKQFGLQRDSLTGKIIDSNGNEVSTLEYENLQLQKDLTKTQMIDPKTGKLMYNADGSPKMIDVNTAKAMIETNNRIESQLFQADMQKLQQAFEEKGMNFTGLYSQIQNMPEEMAKDYINSMAEYAGIKHVALDSKGKPITVKDENGNEVPLEVAGFRNIEENAYSKNGYINQLLDLGGIPKEALKPEAVANLKDGWEIYQQKYPGSFVENGKGLESLDTNTWNSGRGTNWWGLSGQANAWIDANKGKLVKGEDGNVYRVVGKTNNKDTNKTQAIILQNVQTLAEVKYSDGAGGSERYYFS